MNSDSEPSTSKGPSSSSTEATLWVDRYRPKRFTDLLGDERVHREVLAWVKQWDLCVFGKGKGKKRARDEEGFNPEDELGRPQEKVSFLRQAEYFMLTMIDIAVVWTSRARKNDACACCCFPGWIPCLRNQRKVCFLLSRTQPDPENIPQ